MYMQLRVQKNARNLGEALDIQMHLRSDAHLSPFFFFPLSPPKALHTVVQVVHCRIPKGVLNLMKM